MHVLWPAAAPAAQPWPRFVMGGPCMPYVPTSGRLPQTCDFYGTYAINFRKKCENVSKNDPASSSRTVKGANLDPKSEKACQRHPKVSQRFPWGAEKLPKWPKRVPKWSQNGTKIEPRGAPEGQLWSKILFFWKVIKTSYFTNVNWPPENLS